MMDLRYHVISLVAVFLALAAGFVMGAALTGSDTQAEALARLTQEMDNLRRRDNEIKAENQRLEQQLAAWEQAGRDLRGPILDGLLAGERVAVFMVGMDRPPAYWPELRTTLEASGAAVGPIAYLPDDPQPLPEALRQRFAVLWGDEGPAGGRYQAAAWLLEATAAGGYGQRVTELAAAGIRVEGSFSEPVGHFLVLVDSAEAERLRRAARRDVPEAALIEAAAGAPARLVLAEAQNVFPSAVAQSRGRGIPTVDNVDTVLGQLAAVLALRGADGAFGVKPGAARVLPPVVPRPR